MRYYTGVGSRDVPAEIARLQKRIGRELAKKGFSLLTGGATGSDYNFLYGACRVNPELAQVWRPVISNQEPSAGSIPSFAKGVSIHYIDEDEFEFARHYMITEGVLPTFDGMDAVSQNLHARNYYQIFSIFVVAPSEFVVYYAKEFRGVVRGGTRSAVGVGRVEGIPTYNLYYPEQRDAFLTMIEGL